MFWVNHSQTLYDDRQMMTPTKNTNMLLLCQVTIMALFSGFLYRQLSGIKPRASSVYTLLPQKETLPMDCFTVFRRCVFTLDEIVKNIALNDTNMFIDATRPTTLSLLACSSVFAQSLKPDCCFVKAAWRRLSVSWKSLILLLQECYGSPLLLKHRPRTKKKK